MDVIKLAKAPLNFCILTRGALRLCGGSSTIENERLSHFRLVN